MIVPGISQCQPQGYGSTSFGEFELCFTDQSVRPWACVVQVKP